MDTMDSYLPIHYKFRFTFTDQTKDFKYEDNIPRWRSIARTLVQRILNQYTVTKLTGGIETLNKDGDRTWCHVHVHFDAVENKESIARYIKRFLSDTYDQNVTGVKCFSLKPEAMLKSFDEFYQYPLKQNLDNKLCYGFSDEKLQHLHGVGKSSYLKVQQVRQSKMDKYDNSDTMFERLTKYLQQDIYKNTTSKVSLLIAATKFYVEENKPINRQTIQGYVDTYMLAQKLITYEDFWQSPN